MIKIVFNVSKNIKQKNCNLGWKKQVQQNASKRKYTQWYVSGDYALIESFIRIQRKRLFFYNLDTFLT